MVQRRGERPESDGVWRFAATEPISTYITCVVAGPYHYVRLLHAHLRRRPHAGHPARRDVPQGARQALRRRRRLPVTKQGLDFFHGHFDFPYPFGKYDQAFVPEYNLGAMENPGR